MRQALPDRFAVPGASACLRQGTELCAMHKGALARQRAGSTSVFCCGFFFFQDLQNLTQRFKTKQSASLQQAVYWADRAVLIPAVAPAALATDDTVGSTFQQEPAVISAASGSSQSSSSSSSEDSSQTSNLASRSDSSTSSSTSSSSGVADVHVAAAAAAGPASSSEAEAGGSCSDLQRQQQHLAEKAARLSFAALQGVPQESAKVSA